MEKITSEKYVEVQINHSITTKYFAAVKNNSRILIINEKNFKPGKEI